MQSSYRIRLKLPEVLPFNCHIAVRVTDLNYGQHVGNERILQYLQEARAQFFDELGYSELDFAGTGIIMADAAIQYRKELKYPALLQVTIGIVSLSTGSCTLAYRLICEPQADGKAHALIAEATTTLVSFDYNIGKPAPFAKEALSKLEAFIV